MESKSDPTILYLHPEGKYELKRFALALGPKVKAHDLLMKAIEEWAQRKGDRRADAGAFRAAQARAIAEYRQNAIWRYRLISNAHIAMT